MRTSLAVFVKRPQADYQIGAWKLHKDMFIFRQGKKYYNFIHQTIFIF